MPGFDQTFVVTDDPAGDFDRPVGVQFRPFNPANNANVPGRTDPKAGQYITADNDCSYEIDIADAVIDVPVDLVYGEYV